MGEGIVTEPQGGETATDWKESLPEDLRGAETLGKFKGKDAAEIVPALAKSYVELEKVAGGNLKMPNDTSKPEEWNSFYQRLGRPDKPEGYDVKRPEDLHPNVLFDDALIKRYREEAHKLGLSKHQAEGLAGPILQELSKRAGEVTYTPERGEAELRNIWKDDESFKQGVANCQLAVRELADQDFVDLLNKTGLGNHPSVVRFLSKIGGLFEEDAPGPGDGGGGMGMTPDQAKAQIAMMLNDPKHPIHKGDPTAIAEKSRLYKIAYGGKVVTTLGA